MSLREIIASEGLAKPEKEFVIKRILTILKNMGAHVQAKDTQRKGSSDRYWLYLTFVPLTGIGVGGFIIAEGEDFDRRLNPFLLTDEVRGGLGAVMRAFSAKSSAKSLGPACGDLLGIRILALTTEGREIKLCVRGNLES